MGKLRIARHFAVARWLRRFRTRRALERFQDRRIRRHLRFLRRRSPRLAELLGSGPVRLEALPLMDKRTMMADFGALNTVGVDLDTAVRAGIAAERSRTFDAALGDITVGLSSGTTGHRGVFLVSGAERDAWAGTMLALTLPRGRLLGHRIALFLRAGSELYETVRSRVIDFRYYDIQGDMAAHARDLAGYAPTILVAPPSVLRVLAADEQAASLRPHKVYSVAEVLTDHDAEQLARAFGQPVIHQLYQCTEGFLARTCERGTLHLNEEVAFFEREPVEGPRFIPIVTDFSRTSQAIVRYRHADVLVERADLCPCGSVLTALERIEGREDDTLLIGGVRVFADLVTRAMAYADGVDEYRVVQTGPERVEVHLDAADAGAEASVRAELEALWGRVGAPAPQLEFRPYRADLTRKLRRVERAWKGASDAGV